jgi:hypothetical protein
MMATLPAHLSVSCDGALLRARRLPCFDLVVVRENYERHHREIKTVADLKACLRAGKYAWPGGYACYFITSDGAVLSFETVRREFAVVAYAVKAHHNSGWQVVGLGCTADCDETPVCDHTGKEID